MENIRVKTSAQIKKLFFISCVLAVIALFAFIAINDTASLSTPLYIGLIVFIVVAWPFSVMSIIYYWYDIYILSAKKIWNKLPINNIFVKIFFLVFGWGFIMAWTSIKCLFKCALMTLRSFTQESVQL